MARPLNRKALPVATVFATDLTTLPEEPTPPEEPIPEMTAAICAAIHKGSAASHVGERQEEFHHRGSTATPWSPAPDRGPVTDHRGRHAPDRLGTTDLMSPMPRVLVLCYHAVSDSWDAGLSVTPAQPATPARRPDLAGLGGHHVHGGCHASARPQDDGCDLRRRVRFGPHARCATARRPRHPGHGLRAHGLARADHAVARDRSLGRDALRG
jgi:hypothetical protein